MNLWSTLILNPMVNAMIWLYGLFGNSYFFAILILTGVIRLLVFPLTWQQMRSSQAMQDIQPELKKLQEKHKGDPETLQQKTMALYREKGVSPLGGCLPSLIQFPILIGLYQAITRTLAATPLQLINLSQHIYHVVPAWLPDATSLIPLHSHFLWLDLSAPDPYPVLPILVIATTFLQQRLLTPSNPDPQQAQMTRTMQFTMPLMIGWFSLTFPSGLSIYWIVSNVIGTLQYALLGRASLRNLFGTEDGSFSLMGLLGLSPAPEADSKSGSGGSRSGGSRSGNGRKK
jgi:YidC/Oxa1 family membrane protein insertase